MGRSLISGTVHLIFQIRFAVLGAVLHGRAERNDLEYGPNFNYDKLGPTEFREVDHRFFLGRMLKVSLPRARTFIRMGCATPNNDHVGACKDWRFVRWGYQLVFRGESS
jgi:hypothetical protein